jgi:hypothetical protein
MQGSLGEKIGEGAFADVHAWAPGQVVKLFKAGVRQRTSSHEAQMIRAAFSAGVPTPEVLGEVTLEGRFGIVLTRLDGPTLLQLSRTSAMTSGQVGAILATLAIGVHTTPPPAGVLSLREWMDATLRLSGGMLPEHIATGILTLIERLAPGDGLCHGDLHPGNVIMTADGPRLIDWTYALGGHRLVRIADQQPTTAFALPDPFGFLRLVRLLPYRRRQAGIVRGLRRLMSLASSAATRAVCAHSARIRVSFSRGSDG